MSSNYPAGVSDRDDYFDLPNAGEDQGDEGDYCRRCGCLLTEADYEGERCSQCGFRLKGREKWKQQHSH